MSEDGMGDEVPASPDKVRRGMMSSLEDHVFWTGNEVDKLIECWSQNAEAVNSSRNEKAMAEIAEYIGTNKSAKQVRAKLKKMRCRYIQEKEKLEEGKGPTKWRFFNKLNKFGHKIIKNPNRKPKEPMISELNEYRNPKIRLQALKDNSLGGGIALNMPAFTSMSELPPVYPYDPDVPADVVVDSIWTNWNATLPYAMTDSGLRTLMRSGFRDVSHLELLKRKNANIAMLNLNYHDKLALEHALDSDNTRAQQYQVITNDDGTVIEVRGCADNEDTLLLTPEGVKLATWNKELPHPLSDMAVIKLIKAGFTSPADVTALVTDDEIEDMELSVRDKAALRKLVLTAQNAM